MFITLSCINLKFQSSRRILLFDMEKVTIVFFKLFYFISSE